MSLVYFERWNAVTKQFRELLTESEAKRRHEAGLWYSIACYWSNSEHPDAFVVLHDRGAGVEFLDSQCRSYLDYSFDRDPTGRLFLLHSIFRRFEGMEGTPREAIHMKFSSTGQVEVTVHDLVDSTVKDGTKPVDVTGNWVDFPEFGNYQDLVREER